MAESLNVEWTEHSQKQLSLFYDQIKEKWGTKEAEHFLDLVQEFEHLVSRYPQAFIRSKKRRYIRLGLIHRHISVVYKVEKEKVIIISLIDNRSGLKEIY